MSLSVEVLIAYANPEVGYKLYPNGEVVEWHIRGEVREVEDLMEEMIESELYTEEIVSRLLGQLSEDEWDFGFVEESLPFIGLWMKDPEADSYIVKRVLPKGLYLYKYLKVKPEVLEEIKDFGDAFGSKYNKLYSEDTLEYLAKYEFWQYFEYGWINC